MKISILDPLAAALCGLFVCLVFCLACARADNLPSIPTATSLIVDQTKLLTADERTAVEARLKKFKLLAELRSGF